MTKMVDAKLLFEYQEPDRSVGINGGFVFLGIEVESLSGTQAGSFIEANYESGEGEHEPFYTLEVPPIDQLSERLEDEVREQLSVPQFPEADVTDITDID